MSAPAPDTAAVVAVLRAMVAALCPSRCARHLQLDLRVDFYDNADPLRLCMPLPLAGQPPPSLPSTPTASAKHGPDFRSVNWFGTVYTFSPTQAAVVRQLWEAWENGTPDIGHETLIEASGSASDSAKLSDIFHGHPVWNSMIRSQMKGTYRLFPPSDD